MPTEEVTSRADDPHSPPECSRPPRQPAPSRISPSSDGPPRRPAPPRPHPSQARTHPPDGTSAPSRPRGPADLDEVPLETTAPGERRRHGPPSLEERESLRVAENDGAVDATVGKSPVGAFLTICSAAETMDVRSAALASEGRDDEHSGRCRDEDCARPERVGNHRDEGDSPAHLEGVTYYEDNRDAPTHLEGITYHEESSQAPVHNPNYVNQLQREVKTLKSELSASQRKVSSLRARSAVEAQKSSNAEADLRRKVQQLEGLVKEANVRLECRDSAIRVLERQARSHNDIVGELRSKIERLLKAGNDEGGGAALSPKRGTGTPLTPLRSAQQPRPSLTPTIDGTPSGIRARLMLLRQKRTIEALTRTNSSLSSEVQRLRTIVQREEAEGAMEGNMGAAASQAVLQTCDSDDFDCSESTLIQGETVENSKAGGGGGGVGDEEADEEFFQRLESLGCDLSTELSDLGALLDNE